MHLIDGQETLAKLSQQQNLGKQGQIKSTNSGSLSGDSESAASDAMIMRRGLFPREILNRVSDCGSARVVGQCT